MADSSIVTPESGQPDCYVSDSSTDQCSGDITESDSDNNGLNHCCGASARADNNLNSYYRLSGVVDCEACELYKSEYKFYISKCRLINK